MINILEVFSKVSKNEGVTITRLEQIIGASKGVLSRAITNNSDIQSKWLLKLVENYPHYNSEWLLTGKGPMLKEQKDELILNEPSPEHLIQKNKLIPLYNDVATVGGVNVLTANLDAVSSTTEYIDAGDFFPDASAAIRHYGDSMVEYPNGSIIVLKEVMDQRLLIWGKSYCIETTEGRITKKLNKSPNKEILIGYSSNKDVYPDGSLIHQPVEIPKDMIRKMYLVLGSVNKEYSSGSVKIIEKIV